VLLRVIVDLALDDVDMAVGRKNVTAAARHVVSTKMLGGDPQVRRGAIQFIGRLLVASEPQRPPADPGP